MSKSNDQIFLGNLSYDITKEDLQEVFDALNVQIGEIRIPRDDGRGKGFAFIDIASSEPLSVGEIISMVRETMILGRPCRADFATPKAGKGGERRQGGESRPSGKRGSHRRRRGNQETSDW